MKVSSHIDWIQGTYETADMVAVLNRLRFELGKPLRPINGYKVGHQLEPFGSIFWGSKEERMGLHIVMTGSDCQKLRNRDGSGDVALLSDLQESGRKLSRLDLAIDVREAEFTPGMVFSAAQRDAVKTRLAFNKAWVSLEGVQTAYWGSRSGNGRKVRVYDKAIEQKLPDDSPVWTRVEMQCHKGAKTAAAMVIRGDDIRAIIKKYWDIPGMEVWQEATQVAPVNAPHIPDKEPDTLAWLLATVPKPLGRVLAECYREGGSGHAMSLLDELMKRGIAEMRKELNMEPEPNQDDPAMWGREPRSD